MSKQIVTVTILAVLLLTPECLSKTVTLAVDWDQAMSIWEHGDFRQSVKVRLRSSRQLRGTLAGITDSGARIQKRRSETVIPRDQIRAIRLVPRRSNIWNMRILAIAGGIPAGYLATFGTFALCCGGDADTAPLIMLGFGAWGATQYLLYRLGAKADRGALVLLLPPASSAKGNSDPDLPSPSQEEVP